MASSTKHHSLSLSEKYQVVRCYEGEKVNVKGLMTKFNCGKTLIYKVIKNKEKIKSDYLSGKHNVNAKRKIRKTGNEEINRILYEWFLYAQSRNLPISGPILQTQARQIAERLGNNDFKASNGWLECFRKRHNISYKQICGEAKGVGLQILETWKSKLAEIIKDYKPCDIANCAETGLFFRALPRKTMTLKEEKCADGKQETERLTVLVCGYADGKLEKPLVIGKSAKPRCFRNLDIGNLPVDWKSNKKAYMTASLMEQWLKALNMKMFQKERKILMFLDTSACHPHLNLSNIKLCFLPPNSTSITQPMNQGVIQSLKVHYRKHVLKALISNMSQSSSISELAKQISVLDAVRWIASAYRQVQPKRIVKSFQKAGFNFNDENVENITKKDDDDDDDDEVAMDMEEIEHLMDIAEEQEVLPFEFVNVDAELITDEGFQTIDMLIDSALGKASETVDEEDETESKGLGIDEEVVEINSHKEALKTLSSLEAYAVRIQSAEVFRNLLDVRTALERNYTTRETLKQAASTKF